MTITEANADIGEMMGRILPAPKLTPAPYKLIGREIGEWTGGMYRFYCYPSSWHISPAALAGHTY